MSFLPSSHTAKSHLYSQMASMTAAGLPARTMIETLAANPVSRAFGPPLRTALVRITQGESLTLALGAGNWLPDFDLHLIGAGEQSGGMEPVFRLLADFHESQASMLRTFYAGLVYPTVLIHVGVSMLALVLGVIAQNVWTGIFTLMGMLLPLYIFVVIVVLLLKSRNSFVEKIFGCVPFLGHGMRSQSLSRLSAALGGLTQAGIPPIESWLQAGKACGSASLMHACERVRNSVIQGHPPSFVLPTLSAFPSTFTNLYRTGEQSGTLDETFIRLQKYYAEEGQRSLKQLSILIPALVYGLVVLGVAVLVISLFLGYIRLLNDLMQ
ncbi:MAG: type II secretion system F family protein [Verrucomicrobiae bacterium]|nr:type II secretion system F family protein [Verrucomicrobiae bacterium]